MRLTTSLSFATMLAVVTATAAVAAGTPDRLRPGCYAPSASSTVCWPRPCASPARPCSPASSQAIRNARGGVAGRRAAKG